MSEVKKLTTKCFELHPVWAWTEDEQSYVPVEETSPLPSDRGPLLIKAKLYPANGPELHGYVIGLGAIYAIGVLVNDGEYVFNSRLSGLAPKVASRLFAALNTAPCDLFPLRYETDFTFANESRLKGVFRLES